MSDLKKRGREYLARAEDLEKQAARSDATRTELLHIAQEYRLLADEIDANFSLSEETLFTPSEGRIGNA